MAKTQFLWEHYLKFELKELESSPSFYWYAAIFLGGGGISPFNQELLLSINKHENKIMLAFFFVGLAVSMTRSNVGIWNLKSGELTTNISKVG